MSAELVLPSPSKFSATAFRNIYTIKETQNLFDDLVSDPKAFGILQAWDNESSGIDHKASPLHRPFQYGEISTIDVLMDPGRWSRTRFSDGTFGVWYGALEENTSIQETLYHSYQFAKPDLADHYPVIIERKMFSAEVAGDLAVDLRKLRVPELISNDYTFCQQLGRRAIEEKTQLYLSPSARERGGTCLAVFQPECLKSDRALYFLKFTFLNESQVRVTKDLDELTLIPKSWNESEIRS